nr:uncharacterized protein LOC114826911 [Malus domestica]
MVSALSPLLLRSVNRFNTSLISRIVPALSTLLLLLLPLPTDSTRWPSSHRPPHFYESSIFQIQTSTVSLHLLPQPLNRSFSDLKEDRKQKIRVFYTQSQSRSACVNETVLEKNGCNKTSPLRPFNLPISSFNLSRT